MANYQELANLVWNVADDVLRGLFKPHEYGDITLPFLVLRRLDCILEENGRKEKAIDTYNHFKDQVPEDRLPPIIQRATNTSFYNTSQYDLSRLKADPNNIRLNFDNYLNGFSQDVRDIIENFNLDRFIERLHNNNRLFIFCDKFTEVDLHPNKVDNHTMGQVFEELLRRFSEMSFDYMITNPPFGVSWKSDTAAVKTEAQTATGRFSAGTPRSSDGALLFLQHMLSKMEARGSRVGIVFRVAALYGGCR